MLGKVEGTPLTSPLPPWQPITTSPQLQSLHSLLARVPQRALCWCPRLPHWLQPKMRTFHSQAETAVHQLGRAIQ